jgi:hypothetical protein
MESQHNTLNWFGSIASAGAIITSWIGLLPTIMTVAASGVALLWYIIQIWESETVAKWRQARMRKRLIRLHREAMELELMLTDPRDRDAIGRLKQMSAQRIELDAGLEQAHRDRQTPAADAETSRD